MEKVCNINKDVLVVRLCGDLDHHVTEQIREEIDNRIQETRLNKIAFDFRNVSFMDSSGIGLLMGRYKKMMLYGGEVYVSNLNFSIQRIFRLSGLFRILKQSKEIDRIVNDKEATYE